ncbi:hypothetical protein HH682_12135 [Rosenbergiella sp. S61]|uniref:Uncharacterized protein n=1 Tax=Rosenbergiella gaditana TaxID=2726987 RepID=A0ABS5SYP0_9GAMM|nr:hypothetical protein [Rosenbergiella gaditana]MBT0725151.1 hypothetical protein [Rosenbergiella gaditana]
MKLLAKKPLLVAGDVIAEGELFTVTEQRGRELVLLGYATLADSKKVEIVTQNDSVTKPSQRVRVKKAVDDAES